MDLRQQTTKGQAKLSESALFLAAQHSFAIHPANLPRDWRRSCAELLIIFAHSHLSRCLLCPRLTKGSGEYIGKAG